MPIYRGQLLHHAAERTGEDANRVLKLVFDTCRPEIDDIMYSEDALAYELYKRGGGKEQPYMGLRGQANRVKRRRF